MNVPRRVAIFGIGLFAATVLLATVVLLHLNFFPHETASNLHATVTNGKLSVLSPIATSIDGIPRPFTPSPTHTSDGMTTYANMQYGFHITYPRNFSLYNIQQSASGFPTGLGEGFQFVAITAPAGSSVSASILVSIGQGPDDSRHCLSAPVTEDAEVVNVTHETINGAYFVYYETWSPGTGQIGADHIYKVLHQKKMFCDRRRCKRTRSKA
jgi:hypothetical protein